ncbi:hypothetical protein TCAL_06045 [Tigriopus californicus]|uniref:Nitric oxide synthase-interacting protein homolog n=1 Tax=Tigriopus californicus TaxID=6832 RepID=A0A553PQB6_TIGCA|nr:nitric oxide synthase-interacting protein-like [Tigriopus californicus]TRY79872.1 hypothetical protein TCAL_06045 [Tigriopus californicus]|eukprot:TCALIF_06045-PA protein Name:"Similar to CG6179 Nitric oxide synthase-interacting protein homolog (Drosophila melanogaster)" AED:0.01 eAED:0.01 QI:0/-1/0/1/-1/1/1/0/297
MTRHGRNATNSAVYSYHERHKDARSSGYGTDHMRLSKDAVKKFDCCSLTLQPCRTPVVTPQGWLYDKEVILQYIVDKRMEYQKKLRAFQAESQKDFQALFQSAQDQKNLERSKFEHQQTSIKSPSTGSTPSSSSSASSSSGVAKPVMPSFWLPSRTPDSTGKPRTDGDQPNKRPDKTVLCPCSGRPLKVRDLIAVKFRESKPEADAPASEKAFNGYQCAVTGDVLRDSVRCFVLKPTGDVVTAECVDNIIRKDMTHPLTGQVLVESDLIELQRGGTGFAAANDKLKAAKYRPSLATA